MTRAELLQACAIVAPTLSNFHGTPEQAAASIVGRAKALLEEVERECSDPPHPMNAAETSKYRPDNVIPLLQQAYQALGEAFAALKDPYHWPTFLQCRSARSSIASSFPEVTK